MPPSPPPKRLNPKTKLILGGWYQRTTLHLSEIYDFLARSHSHLSLSSQKLKQLHNGLKIKSVSRQLDYLEYVQATTTNGIEIRYYEDGLYTLSSNTTATNITDYFNSYFNPAISYIFSLGAPTPKVLADIKIDHPIAVSILTPHPAQFHLDNVIYGQAYSTTCLDNIYLYKTPRYIIVVANPTREKLVDDLLEMQIFFREFKDQLERYLFIHRQIWEQISNIKERRFLRGHEVEDVRRQLDNYQKTINLITSRINQMNSYIATRSSIAQKLELESHLVSLFKYKFETLSNTHSYIKDLWKMTNDYLSTAIQVVVEIKNQSTSNGLQSLRLITTIGVVSGIIGYLSRTDAPSVTLLGALFFALLLVLTWFINQLIAIFYQNSKYELKFNSPKV